MAHGLADQQFRWSNIEKWFDSWVASKDKHFYRNGIQALPERWAKVVANDGHWIITWLKGHDIKFYIKACGNKLSHTNAKVS